MVFNTRPYTVLPDNSILITANMQSETGFPSRHQLKSYVASKSRLKLAARCPVSGCWPCLESCDNLECHVVSVSIILSEVELSVYLCSKLSYECDEQYKLLE